VAVVSEDPEAVARKQAIISKYARPVSRRNRTPMRCHPSAGEIRARAAQRRKPPSDGKVIYPDEDAARAAAAELEAEDGRPMRVYGCHRSQHGHFHISTDWDRWAKQRREQQAEIRRDARRRVKRRTR
jgi:hypothetical protein